MDHRVLDRGYGGRVEQSRHVAALTIAGYPRVVGVVKVEYTNMGEVGEDVGQMCLAIDLTTVREVEHVNAGAGRLSIAISWRSDRRGRRRVSATE